MYPIQFLINFIIHGAGIIAGSADNPFITDLKTHVLSRGEVHPEFGLLKDIKEKLSRNALLLEMNDLGAGTKSRQKQKRVRDMADNASVDPKYGELLYRLACYYKPDRIIEFGTALGISAMYMAMGNPDARVITVEGNAELAKIASETFSANAMRNITIINRPFEEVLNEIVAEKSNNTLVFIDGNHTYDATLRYFQAFVRIPGTTSILVFDDINWSTGMMKAWKQITQSPDAGMVVDLFHMGIVFRGWGLKGRKFRFWYR